MISTSFNIGSDAARSAGRFRLLWAVIFAVAAGAFLLGLASPQQAYAEVRKADVIAGMTVEDRGLTVAECPSVDAEYAALMGPDGTLYFERNSGEASQIASITKVMTAMVALDQADEGTVVTVSEAAATIGESSANLVEGDTMDLETALKALLVPSGNDAAVALAECVGAQMLERNPGSGSSALGTFVAAMNEKATELGCANTVYENPHGLDDDEYKGNLHSTAADQVKVAQAAMGYDTIREIVSGGSTTIAVTRDGETVDVELETTDELLEMYEYCIGIKTGVTNLAGPSFMGAANKDGRELYAVVLGSTDEYQRFADTKNLFEWAYDHVHELELANSDESAQMSLNGELRDVPVIADVSLADWPDKTVKATMGDPDATVSVFDLEGNVSQSTSFEELHGTVHEGDKVGTIVFKQRNQVIAEQELIACETVEAPNPIETFSIWWGRLIGGLSGQPAQAESVVYNVMPIIANNVSNAA